MPNTMQPVFISYRRDDSAYVAASVADCLRRRFGDTSVFIDIDNIPLGSDFRTHVNSVVSGCSVVLVIIGNDWLQGEPGRRRIDEHADFVRLEVEAALERDVPVVPVLVDNAAMPAPAELPESIRELAFRNAAEIRPGRDLSNHLEALCDGIAALLAPASPNPTPTEPTPPAPTPAKITPRRKTGRRDWVPALSTLGITLGVALVGLLALVAIAGVVAFNRGSDVAVDDDAAVVDAVQTTPETPENPLTAKPKIEVSPAESEAESEPAPKTAPSLAKAPFDAAQVAAHQQAWANYLDEPVQKTNSIGMKLALIPAGEFMMGSPESEKDRHDDEGKDGPHPVKITRPFYLGTTEVTQAQWTAVMGSTPWKEGEYVTEGANHPATYVNWDDAQAFIAKLNRKEGKTYRLPTEAEWEYACRAGSKTAYHFGDDASQLDEYAWFDKNANNVDAKYAHQVGKKRPNAFGLHDMHGNVWEWCQDWYDGDYYAGSPTNDPVNNTASSSRVLRGGSWFFLARNCRSAYRGRFSPGRRDSVVGFRVVLSCR